MSVQQASYVTGRSFFPHLIEGPFAHGLHLAFTFAAVATLIAVIASALRGRRYLHSPEPVSDELAEGAVGMAEAVGLVNISAQEGDS
jgi:hypothetical protein